MKNLQHHIITLWKNQLNKLWFRVVIAFTIAYTVMAIATFLDKWSNNQEFCRLKEPLQNCYFRQAISIFAPSNIEGFSILTVAILYILESRERRENRIYEAWQVVDNAAAAKVSTSYARIRALEDLNKYRVSLKGIDAPGANFSEINLRNADLKEVDFNESIFSNADLSNADLNGANLFDANLISANLSSANLFFANLSEANLSGANLNGAILFFADLNSADLSNANLIGANLNSSILNNAILFSADLRNAQLWSANLSNADLSDANLSGANLKEANLSGANLSGANLKGANLTGADFRGAKSFEVEQIKSAKNWEEAMFDEL
ncbi:pentapeptide repeat-containing protein [Scytonema sp. UIC 10036]|uniref:pentapeptide repeat-containing protein n=1 Tax=Scytonema sp. UIC 10036 TaxID=2304196 RepID=UPI0012DA6CE8|nr:pentapeptide repeat-containing protein [Scytonema sp. UIC 10036]MUH00915.1 pentapeptide repeat-containing protein [Scytonema sp. UIC 10036]